MRRLIAACLATSAVLTGCATSSADDPLQATDTLVAATPARSPAVEATPQGTVVPHNPAELTAFDPASHTLAVTSDHTLALFDTRALDRAPRTIALPSAPATLRVDRGELLAALPESDLVATIDPRTEQLNTTRVSGSPVDALRTGDLLAVALRDNRSVTFLRNGKPHSTATDFKDPAQLVPAGENVLVLDRKTTSLTPVDPDTGSKSAGLRAGQGATNAVTDRYGRILVTDTRSGDYLAFSTHPLVMKQRYPVDNAPYDIAYDPGRDLAWITLTRTNEVVAYDIGGGQPQQQHRIRTVRQPNSVAVDPNSGEVFVTSATGQGIQVVKV